MIMIATAKKQDQHTALAYCKKITAEYFSVVIGAIMAESHECEMADAILKDWMLNPFQQRVMNAIRNLQEERLPIDQLTVFARMEYEKQLGYKLSMMGARINLHGRTSAYLLIAYEYAIVGRMMEILLPYRKLKGVGDMLFQLSESVHGRAERLKIFETVADYISDYCLIMPFGRVVEELRDEHLKTVKKIKIALAKNR